MASKILNKIIAVVLIILFNGYVLKSQTLQPFCFTKDIIYNTGAQSMCSNDFNGDGNMDLALANGGGSFNLSLMLGNGTGSFTTAGVYSFGPCTDLCSRDFNGDGNFDIAGVEGSNLKVAFGSSTGTLSPFLNYTAGNSPSSLCSVDLNNDGYFDIATCTYGSYSQVSVLLGSSSGTFAAAVTYTILVPTSSSIRSADFNNDGNMDLAISHNNGNNVKVLLGNGTGTFSFNTDLSGSDLTSLCTADFNEDGNMDIASANYNSGNISILQGTGSGLGFLSGNYVAGYNPKAICSSDFNGDGHIDLATANFYGNNCSILLGTGTGSFAPTVNFTLTNYPMSICSADFNNDNKLDLSVSTQQYTHVFLNNPHTPLNIIASSNSICIGSASTLIANSIVTYTWIAGINPLSEVVTPSVTTTYSVVSDNGCIVDTAFKTINVLPLPNIAVNSGSICPNKTFTMSPIGGITYTYSSGSNIVSPLSANQYTVTGIDINGCRNFAISSVSIFTPNIGVNSGYLCLGQGYTITPSGALTYSFSSGTNIVYPISDSQYTVTGTDVNGCISSNIVSVTIVPLPQVQVSTGDTICLGGIATLSASLFGMVYPSICTPSATSNGSLFGDYINSVSISNINNITGASVSPFYNIYSQTTTLTAGSIYTLTLGAGTYANDDYAGWIDFNRNGILDDLGEKLFGLDNAGLSYPAAISFTFAVPNQAYNGTTRMRIMVSYLPSSNNMNPCSYLSNYGETEDYNVTIVGGQEFTTYSWLPVENLNSNISQYPISNSSVSTVYTVTVSQPGCIVSNTLTLTASSNIAPIITITNNSICQGDTLILTPSGALSYSYSSNTPVVSPTTNTTYTLYGADLNGCIGTNTTLIVVNPTPTISITGLNTICLYSNTILTVTGANSYTWSVGAFSNSITVTPTSSQTYTVIGTDINGCLNSAITTVSVYPLPLINIIGNTTLCNNSSTELNATGAYSYLWATTETTSSITVSPTITTTYSVNGTDVNNCSNTQTIEVIVDNTCQDVWPGDANSDGIADNTDILELGLHYTQTGSARTTTNNAWQAFNSTNWLGTITNGKNLNHSDCNGDGTVNNDDTLAIYNNYGLTHTFKLSNVQSSNPALNIVTDQTMVDKGKWGTASIYLGDATNVMNNVNGVAYTLNYDNSFIEQDSIYLTYQNSFIDAGQNLHFRKTNFTTGALYTASTHTNNINMSGFGKIATLHYKIRPDLATDAPLNLAITQAVISSASGSITPITSGASTVMAIGASVGIKDYITSSNLVMYPNPTSEMLNVELGMLNENSTLFIYNALGALVLKENINSKHTTINTSNFAKGLYVVELQSNNHVLHRAKLVKE